MIHDLQVGLKIGVADLLKEHGQFNLDLFSLIEEVELISLFLGQDAIDKFLKLLRTSSNRYLINPKGVTPVVNKVNYHIFRDFRQRLLTFLYFLFCLHLNNRLYQPNQNQEVKIISKLQNLKSQPKYKYPFLITVGGCLRFLSDLLLIQLIKEFIIRYLQRMVKIEDLQVDLINMLEHYDDQYQYLIRVLKSTTWEEFYQHFLAIGQMDRTLISRQNRLFSYQATNIEYLLHQRFKNYNKWAEIDYSKLWLSIRYLAISINFNFEYHLYHNQCPNIFDALHLLYNEGSQKFNDVSSKLYNEFLQNNIDALSNDPSNKQTYSYKCYERISEQEKKRFEIISINCYNKVAKKKLDKSKVEELTQKYINTESPNLFSELLQTQSDLMKQVKEQILGLKYVNEGGQWQLVGECRVNKACLTPQNLNKSLLKYNSNYKYLINNSYVQNEEGIYFKFNILNLIKSEDRLLKLFNLEKFEQNQKDEIKNLLPSIMEGAIKLLDSILNNKKLYIIQRETATIIQGQNIEKVLFYCFKLISYPFRIYYSECSQENDWGGSSNSEIEIQLPIADLRKVINRYIRRYLMQTAAVTPVALDNLCEIFRWMDEIKAYQPRLTQLLSSEDKDEDMSLLFIELLKKYVQQNKESMLYHTGMWLINFLTKQNIQQKMGEEFSQLLISLYRFLIANNKYFKVYGFQLDKYLYRANHKLTYYQMFQGFLVKVPEFSTTILKNWLDELSYFEKNFDKYRKNSNTYRLAMLVIIFNQKTFPINEQIKERLRKLVLSYDFQQFSIADKYKYIWLAFAAKIELNVPEEMQRCFSELAESVKDEQIMSKNYESIYFRDIRPKEMQTFIKCNHLLQFLIAISKNQLSTEYFIRVTDIVLRLFVINANLEKKYRDVACSYSVAELEEACELMTSSFRSNLLNSLQKNFQSIRDYLTKQVKNVKSNNAIIIKLEGFLRYVIQNYKDPYIAYTTLEFITKIVRQKSSKSQCQFFPQFFNYYRDLIFDLLQKLFQHYPFKFENNDPSSSYFQFKFVLKNKKQEKNVVEQNEKLNLQLLEKYLKDFITQLFANQNWESNFLINNIKYDKVNSTRLFEKSTQNELASYLINTFSPEKLTFYHRIYVIINGAYHRRSDEDLQCTKIPMDIELPARPLVIFTKVSELNVYYDNLRALIQKIFQHHHTNQNSQKFEELYNSLTQMLIDQQKQKLRKDLFKQLIQELNLVVTAPDFSSKRYEKIHITINIILESIQESIGEYFSETFLPAYFQQMLKSLENNIFENTNVMPFLKFIVRIIPHSKPQQEDEQFNKYVKLIFFVCEQLMKYIKLQEAQSYLISFIAKTIRLKNPLFDSKIIHLFKSIEPLKDTFSELFCELIEKDLRKASIELEIKCYFLKLAQKNEGNWDKVSVKLTDFTQIFSRKSRDYKKEFIKVVEVLTKKIVIKQQNRMINHLTLNSFQNIQYSIFLNKNFADFEFNGIYKTILTSYIKTIPSDSDKFQMKLRQLRIIAFNYPILVSFILMHPIQIEEKTVSFIDYVLNKITKQDMNEGIYEFIGYISLDLSLIVKVEERPIFFSEYLCYHIIQKLMEEELTNRSLLLIFYMAKIRRFSDLCFLKIKGQKSLCDLIWEKLKASREIQKFQTNYNNLIYIVLSLIYREKSYKSLFKYCQYKSKSNDWSGFNGLVNLCWHPFNDQVLKKNFQQIQLLQLNNVHLSIDIKSYLQLQKSFSKWYDQFQVEKVEDEKIEMATISIKGEYLKHIGQVAGTNGQHYVDIDSVISTSYDNKHRNSFSAFYIYFLEHSTQNNIVRRRRRMKDNQYTFFEKLHQSDDEKDSDDNLELQDEVNANRQSRFAPEEFVRIRNRKKSDDSNSMDLQKELQKKFTAINEQSKLEDQIVESQVEQFTNQMLDALSKINQILTSLQRIPLRIEDVQGKTLEEKMQFLKIKELQTDFDYKELTMGIEQFENYCLANVNKLDRLGSERRNIVRNMEDSMLLKFVQRSVSSDSVDYIIDTIDENYQLLPNTIPHKNSIDRVEEIKPKKQVTKVTYIQSQILPIQCFEDISDDNLYEIILGIYYNCPITPINYLIPFLENKKVQDKIINTLLYIYKNPLDNNHFPKQTNTLDLQKMKWIPSSNKEESITQIREDIGNLFIECITKAFYQDPNYLNRLIGYQGIKDIQYEPLLKMESTAEGYKPIYDILQYSLDTQTKGLEYNEENNCENIFNLFNGVTELMDSQLKKLITILERVHRLSYNRSKNDKQIDYDDVLFRFNQEKAYNFQKNLGELLKKERVREEIKAAFPIQAEDRDAFFIYLLMNTGIYSREELLKFHRFILEKNEAKSSNVYFCNKAFKLYSQEQLSKCIWLKQCKAILTAIIKHLPKNEMKLKEEPFYRITAYTQFLNLEFKSQLLQRKVYDYKREISFSGSEQVVAQRKKGIFESAFLDLRNKPDGFWYEDFSVKFMNEEGALESGYGRGVAKDWYAYVTKGMANLNYGIFMKTSKNYYFFNRQSWINPRHLQFLQFIGKLFAISIINRELFVAPSFSILIYKKIVGEKIQIADIVKQFDEGEVIKNIQKLRDFEDDSLFCETFVYEDKRLISNRNLEILKRKRSMEAIQTNIRENNLYLIQEAVEMKQQQPQHQSKMNEQERLEHEELAPRMIKVLKIGQSFELKPGGADIPVTMQNREEFIKLTKEKIYETIVNGVEQQFNAFMVGFKRIVKPDFIKSFSAEDLREIAEGCDKISIDDLKKHVTLPKAMENSEQIEWFWSCLQALSPRDRMYFIQHWTGLPKISAEGFKGTNLSIVKGQFNGRLFAQTCFNKLHFPEFSSKQKLEQAITMVINSVKLGESIIQD